MSDTTNKTLSDLFSAARAEERVEFVSQQEAARLVSNSVMHDVPQSMWQRINVRLLSTPLRLSITAMTSAALITIGTLAVRSLTGSAPTIITQPQIAQAQHQQSHYRVIAVDTTAKRSRTRETSTSVVPVNALLPAAPMIQAVPVIPDVPGVAPVSLTSEQAKELGIKLDDDGYITIVTKGEEEGYALYTFPPQGGIHIEMSPSVSSEDLEHIRVQQFLPQLVTNPDGSKRLITMHSDSLFDKISDNGHTTVKVKSRFIYAPGDTTRMAVSELPDSEKWIKVYGDSTVAHNSDGTEIRFNIDTTLKSFGLEPSKFHTKVKVMIRKDAFVKNDTMWKHHIADTTMQNMFHSIVNADSMIGAMNLRNGHYEISEDRKILENMLHVGHQFDEYVQHPLDLNKLIPIRIINDKNPSHRNELIFWYEPKPEIMNLLPAAKQNSHEVKAHSFDVSVYPNPTNGPATLNYTFKQGASVTFTLRNLLGQKVMEIGNANGSAGTTGNLTFDLSHIDAGLYLLVTTTDDGEQSVERIVVNK